jgi:hypothetical protein
MSVDGVCQAPGGPEEDLDNDFAHGGWWFRHMDLEMIGGLITETMGDADALLFGPVCGLAASAGVRWVASKGCSSACRSVVTFP